MARMGGAGAERRIHEAAVRIFTMTGRTDLKISELALEAGLARGTVYQHIPSDQSLFDHVASRLTGEMARRVERTIAAAPAAPADRLAMGIRLYIRRAHEEPHWGQFFYTFGFRTTCLERHWADFARNLVGDLKTGRPQDPPEPLGSTALFIAGVIAGAMYLVCAGHETWRNAGTQAVEFVFQALGLPAAGMNVSGIDLPPLLPDD